MNQNTLLTVAVIGGIAAVGYYVWKKNQTQAAPPVAQTPTAGNTTPASNSNNTAAIINAGSDALQKVADIFGA